MSSLAEAAQQRMIEYQEWDREPFELGPMSSYSYRTDPRRLLFMLARYKFCAKMLHGDVVELGCGDAFGTPIVAQAVNSVLATDLDESLIEGNTQRLASVENIAFAQADVVLKSFWTNPRAVLNYDGMYSLDVLEHIDSNDEEAFVRNSSASLNEDGIYIVGTPNLKASEYASPVSRTAHINLKDGDSLKALLQRHFKNVLMFSMNDEVVHTGFQGMAHYLFGVGIGPKS